MPVAIHPLLVHFPVALLLVGTGGLIWGLFRPEQAGLQAFASGALGLGYVGLIFTVATGLFDLQASPKEQALSNWITLTVIHLLCGVSLLAVYGFLLFRRFFTIESASTQQAETSFTEQGGVQTQPRLQTRLDKVSLALAITGIILVIATAWLGGMLVYEYRVGIS